MSSFPQCKQYVSQYGPLVVQQLMSMVSTPLAHRSFFPHILVRTSTFSLRSGVKLVPIVCFSCEHCYKISAWLVLRAVLALFSFLQ